MQLTNEELKNITGGGIAIKAKVYFIGGLITFMIGVLDGFIRPLRCNY